MIWTMTFHSDTGAPGGPAVLTPEVQRAVWFLGGLIRIRAGADATARNLAVLEHQGERGYGSPVHRHLADDETFFVIDGELRVEVSGEAHAVGAGAVAFLPRQLPHGFVVTSPQARFLTLHTPAGFDRFTLAAGSPVTGTVMGPPDEVPPDPAALAELAASYGIEVVGPPLSP
ncbi:cupin domain-containing protein [Mycobacterium sp. 663a-19]|uniref:cupin domain-containing protein n=1 Tax=Mycobacterium sp. 663a-19 TaxID=2986148 RepID=UPI002D1F5ACE|nr:cupin domain-containing protein [Mycobacterium sp. 663a-19]MEB3980910.1 cupin domain-containing protein [Mycobacterium sp. 663a-19]